jgi:hypothetical protein
MKIFFSAIAVVGTLAISCGCSSNKTEPSNQPSSQASASPSSPPITNPCSLLTQAEASEAIGAKLGPSDLRRFGIVTRCTYSNRGSDQGLWLDVRNETAPVADAALFDSYTHMPDVKPIAGIGDQALWTHSQIGTGLDILKGGRLVQIGLPRTMATMTPAVQKAAQLIASRM